MNRWFRMTTLGVACSVAPACGEPPAAPRDVPDSIQVIRQGLPPLAGHTAAVLHAVTDELHAVGKSWAPPHGWERAGRWSGAPQPQDLGSPGDGTFGPATRAVAMNRAGAIVGNVSLGGDEYAVRWLPGESVDTLGYGYAHAINAIGQVAGCVYWVDSFNWLATLWEPDGTPRTLGSLGGNSSCAYAVNDSGWVAGGARDSTRLEYAFLWKPGTGMTSLGTLGRLSRAYGLNNSGTVVGFSEYGMNLVERPFVWTQATGMQALPLLHVEAQSGAAYAVNDAGDIVGYSTRGGTDREFVNVENAVLWKGPPWIPINLTERSMPGYGRSVFGRVLAISPSGVMAGWQYWWQPGLATLQEATLWFVETTR